MDVEEKQKYIHYGSSEFDKNRFKPIKNGYMESKPFGGLWASPVDSKCGWSNWCKAVEFRLDALTTSFSFVLTDEAKVLHLKSGSDVDKLPEYNPFVCINAPLTYIDFEALAKDYDAIEGHLYEEEEQDDIPWQNQLSWRLYTWDCHSILIMNPDIVVPISGRYEWEESKMKIGIGCCDGCDYDDGTFHSLCMVCTRLNPDDGDDDYYEQAKEESK